LFQIPPQERTPATWHIFGTKSRGVMFLSSQGKIRVFLVLKISIPHFPS
jgi:hypothetical protein